MCFACHSPMNIKNSVLHFVAHLFKLLLILGWDWVLPGVWVEDVLRVRVEREKGVTLLFHRIQIIPLALRFRLGECRLAAISLAALVWRRACPAPVGVVVSVQVRANAKGTFKRAAVFAPHAIIGPSVRVAIRIDQGLDDKFEVIAVLGKLALIQFVQEPHAIGRRDPLARMNTAINRNHLRVRLEIKTQSQLTESPLPISTANSSRPSTEDP